jgi:hypothetical protein
LRFISILFFEVQNFSFILFSFVLLSDLRVNEVPETCAGLIDLTRAFVITEKMDGSLISPFYTMGRLRFATKQGVTDTTTLVERYV